MKSFMLEGASQAAITALNWASLATSSTKVNKPKSPLDFSVHLRKLESLNPNLSMAAKDTLTLLADCGNPCSVLVVCDDHANVQFMFNGKTPLAKFSLSSLIKEDDQNLCSGLPVSDGSIKINKVKLAHNWAELGILASVQHPQKGSSQVYFQVDTEAIKELVLENPLILDFFAKLPELELYLDYMDKRVTKCKDGWLKFYRSYQGSFGSLATKIKERDARTGSMNPEDY